jgi:trimeric autotransporter adhesin
MSGKTPFLPVLSCLVAFGAASCGENLPANPSCGYSVTSSTQAFAAAGGSGTVTIATGTTCSWSATADSPWVSLSGAASGSGPATLQFTVVPNSASAPRKATLTVAGQPLALTQEGRAPCEYVVSPVTLDVGAAGGPASIAIATAAGCEWTVTSGAPWVSVTSAASGSGSASVSVLVAANASTDERQATLVVAARSIALRQAGATPAPPPPVTCEYTVSPTDVVEHWHGTGFTVNISTSIGCHWTATASEGWLSLNQTSGEGSASIGVSYSQFTDDATRRAAVQLRWPTPTAGQNVWVAQEGCRYGLEASASFTAAGGTRMVTVVTQALSPSCAIGCPWTATSNVPWVRVTSSMPRAGDDAFSYLVEANTGVARVGTITMAGRTHTITQAGI